jgi:hypothetical protein
MLITIIITTLLLGNTSLAIDLDKNLTQFGPVAENIGNRSVKCSISNNLEPSLYGLYKNSDQIDYSSSNWVNNISSSFNEFDHLVDLSPSDTKGAYDEDDGVWLLVIDIKRRDGVPYYRYLSNHNRHNIPFEPWSSAKFLASSAAISKARLESYGKIGGNAQIGNYKIADLITTAFSYQPTNNVTASSNEVSNFLLRSASEKYSSDLISKWLKITDGSNFQGKFGAPVFDPGTDIWKNNKSEISLPFDYYSGEDNKAMTLLTMGEWVKRLAMHSSDKKTAMPFLKDEDIENLFYGSEAGIAGGALKGTSLYLSKAISGIDSLGAEKTPHSEANIYAQKKMVEVAGEGWRIFQKNGAGPSTSRNRGEVTLAAYVCLPNLKAGKEFVIIGRSSIKNKLKCNGSENCYDVVNGSSTLMKSSVNNVVNYMINQP